jgi:hypothetical protein
LQAKSERKRKPPTVQPEMRRAISDAERAIMDSLLQVGQTAVQHQMASSAPLHAPRAPAPYPEYPVRSSTSVINPTIEEFELAHTQDPDSMPSLLDDLI